MRIGQWRTDFPEHSISQINQGRQGASDKSGVKHNTFLSRLCPAEEEGSVGRPQTEKFSIESILKERVYMGSFYLNNSYFS